MYRLRLHEENHSIDYVNIYYVVLNKWETWVQQAVEEIPKDCNTSAFYCSNIEQFSTPTKAIYTFSVTLKFFCTIYWEHAVAQ
jgi:hypothetical protein